MMMELIAYVKGVVRRTCRKKRINELTRNRVIRLKFAAITLLGVVSMIETPAPASSTAMARRKRLRSALDRRLKRELAVLKAYQRHDGSTTQREDAAAELGMDLSEFRELLEGARRHGFDVEAKPELDQ